MANKQEATIDVLTAEVKTLMIGSRQVTLSVWKQLDLVPDEDIIPFGRVSPGDGNYGLMVWNGPVIWVVGKHKETGALVRSHLPLSYTGRYEYPKEKINQWKSLDLIVLAGLGLR